MKGSASVIIDTLPRPIIRFDFQTAPKDGNPSDESRIRAWLDPNSLSNGELSCATPLGKLAVYPTNSTGGRIKGEVGGWGGERKENFTSAKFFVINGPSHRGSPIKLENAYIAGRLQTITETGATVTIDRLFSDEKSVRTLYNFTHIAEIRLNNLQEFSHFEAIATNLFRALSLMCGRWVGLLGPWAYVKDTFYSVSPQVTKTTRNSAVQNWYHYTLPGVFEELFACFQKAFQEKERGEVIQLGLHWLIESQLCSGGIEGAITLQQAGLEALSWFDIVQIRKLCSMSDFDKLPAAEKIRWFTSLYRISTAIPGHCRELLNYAKDNTAAGDLPGILVAIRNSLIHASPKKLKRLFGRDNGDAERTELWHLTTGLFEQAVLATAGYRWRIFPRDLEVEWGVSAISPAPWI